MDKPFSSTYITIVMAVLSAIVKGLKVIENV